MTETRTKPSGMGLAGESFFSAKDLQQYAVRRQQAELAKEAARKAEMAKAEAEQIKRLMEPVELTEERITSFMHRVRQAAEQGEHEILVLRFPSAMCRDSGRAINNSLPGWEETLVGLPAQMLRVGKSI